MPSCLVGGSTRGLGRIIAKHLAREGWLVGINGRDKELAQSVVRDIEADGGNAVVALFDMTDYNSVAEGVDSFVRECAGEPFQGLVASGAAMATSGPFRLFLNTDPKWFMRYPLAHFISRAYLLQAAARAMIKVGSPGSLVSLSTEAGMIPFNGEAMIGASAAGLIFLTKVLASELGPFNIRINCLTLGYTEASEIPAEEPPGRRPDFVEAIGHIIQDARKLDGVATDQAVADVVSFILSDKAREITGVTVPVSGGVFAHGLTVPSEMIRTSTHTERW